MMGDTNKNIADMTNEEILAMLNPDHIRSFNKMREGAIELARSQMTDAEVWEHLIPPFQD